MKAPDLLINGKFLTQRMTGVQRVAYEVTRRLSSPEAGMNVRVAVPGEPVEEYAGIEGLALIRDDSRLPGNLWQQVRLPSIRSALGGPVLWSPCNTGPVFCKNHVLTIHDASVFAGKEWFDWKFAAYYKGLLRMLGRTVRLIVTDSEFSRNELAGYGVASDDRIRVVYCGVDERFRPDKGRLYDFPYILTLGSRDPRKNFRGMLEAWRQLPSALRKAARFVVAGGSGKSFAREVFKGSTEGVHFAGYVADGDLPALYGGAIAFVFPSFYEGFGLPPLEAMASGCPVITSRAASLPEVCGDAVHYVDPHDPGDIAEGIRLVAGDEAYRSELVKKGLERASLFTWERAASEYRDIFNEVQ